MLSEERCSRLLLLGAETVEVCHEQLITQWPWLQSRISESAINARRLNRLMDKVSEWKNQEGGNGQNQHLATGAELEVFDNLARRHGDWLSPTETKYVAASKEARQREERRRAWLFRGTLGRLLLIRSRCRHRNIFLSILAIEQTRIAEQQKKEAQKQSEIAVSKKREADATLAMLGQSLSSVASNILESKETRQSRSCSR